MRPLVDVGGHAHRDLIDSPLVSDAIVRSGSQNAFIEATRPSSWTT